MKTEEILQEIVFPLSRGTYLFSERPAMEGVHAYFCAKEISSLLNNRQLLLDTRNIPIIKNHRDGIDIVVNWALHHNLGYQKELDISVGVVDVIVYADDFGLFEIGTTRPSKLILLLKYISKLDDYYSIHFWPYQSNLSFIFKNWI